VKQPPLDHDTYKLAAGVLTRARQQGKDPVEALYKAGLLATPADDRALQAYAVAEVIVRLHNSSPVTFLRRKFPEGKLTQRTLNDLYSSIIDWLGEYVKELRKP
jgi:hypothetical protein